MYSVRNFFSSGLSARTMGDSAKGLHADTSGKPFPVGVLPRFRQRVYTSAPCGVRVGERAKSSRFDPHGVWS